MRQAYLCNGLKFGYYGSHLSQTDFGFQLNSKIFFFIYLETDFLKLIFCIFDLTPTHRQMITLLIYQTISKNLLFHHLNEINSHLSQQIAKNQNSH